MRNLAAHPLTLDEIIATLEGMADDVLDEERIGDMRPLILIEAASLLRTNHALLAPQVHRIIETKSKNSESDPQVRSAMAHFWRRMADIREDPEDRQRALEMAARWEIGSDVPR